MTTTIDETVVKLDPNTVHVSKLNTRQPKVADVPELIESIRNSGQITPAIVRPHPTKPGHYELAAGARRRVACGALKITLDAVIREIPDGDFEDLILADNLQHEDPDPMREALLIERRLAEGANPSAIAARYGKKDLWVKRRMKLLGLTEAAREAWLAGGNLAHFSVDMMEFIGALPPAEQDGYASDEWGAKEYATLKDLTDSHHRGAKDLEGVEWLDDPCTVVDGCGPGCASNTADSLFPDEKHSCGSCTNSECFLKRQGLFIDNQIAGVIGDRPLTDFILLSGSGWNSFMWRGERYSMVSSWEQKQKFKVLKKERVGAKPALDLSVPAKPQIRWIVSKEPEAEVTVETTTGPEKKRESREDRLTGKRLALLNQSLAAAVKEAPVPESVPLLNIVAAFGMSRSRNYVSQDNFTDTWASVDSEGLVPTLDHFSEERMTPEEAVWDAVKPVILGRLNFQKNSDLIHAIRRQDMERIASLIGFDHAEKWTTICTTEAPVPKSWGPGFDALTLQPKAAKAA